MAFKRLRKLRSEEQSKT